MLEGIEGKTCYQQGRENCQYHRKEKVRAEGEKSERAMIGDGVERVAYF